MSLELGAATRAEAGELAALLAVLFSEESEFTPDAAKQAHALERILSDDSVGRIFVARESKQVVGMASLLYSVSTAEGGLVASFEDFVVHPACRGRGVGTALLAYVVAQARRCGVLRLTLLTDAHNERAQALYRRIGFEASSMKAMRLRLEGPRAK